ncbi:MULTISPECIES: ABC transporter substrate-binding protein [unclassified Mycolicibacterium]|uniref:ABC transporter substrate-binding protein n=1 Tax=unclassified Mycolicibacterium TaxID=2636767 RepID=UPI0012DBD762|nr:MULTISPECIES: ABC transporter substrate-binding protein [unclassified Mycolicibacterium]MUL84638.1 ABC transporter substrate-binding protein [Mycolicibacterium sp. CBMA 329]MUL88413.1 ABC transporter substrate-binding protein [Mycolicibacterium sp. CBMA 331]MUM03050.1 ABC transporter substrate-binding protein [Mycolicibacterium sp. CBMA 334]MUM25100.1 ABC transporter substrate-binding protein [Mycolicibacterium sp. CBMA 295]MUM40060.1 ABC transporter substrate-binding protein [Mycolicibacte
MWRFAVVVAASGALAMSGCATNTDTTGPATQTTAAKAEKVDSIANTLPEAIKSSGKLVVGTDPTYPPNEFKDPNGNIIGFDVELMNAIAATLGLTVEYRPSAFDKIIPSVQGGSYNVGMSSFTDSKDREQQVDFVTYFKAGSAWAQKVGAGINPDDACGKKIAVQTATVQDTDELPSRSEKCVTAGKPAIQVVKFDDQTAATSAVMLGQADAMSADSPVTAYAIKQSDGKLEAAGEIFDSAPYGWAVPKNSPLAQSLRQALEHLIESGAYKQVAANWGAENGMIDKPVINGAVS